MAQRWRPREVVPAAVALIAVPVWSRAAQRFGVDGRALDPLGLGLMLLAAAILLLRRRQPLLTLGVVSVAVTLYLARGHPYGPILLTFLLAVYSAARHLPLRRAAPATAIAVGVLLSHLLVRQTGVPTATGASIAAAWAVVPFVVGVAVRQRATAAEEAREARLQSRVDAETLRLSRDVHDVVGHGLAAIHLQASVALRATGRDDAAALARAREALSAIESASAASLAELRTVLTRFPEHEAPRSPTPGLAGLPDLVERLSTPDADVRLRIEGTPAPLAAAGDLAAHRVAQEALTNAVRHGRPGTTEVVVRHLPDAVVLEVSNAVAEGVRGASGHAGMGLPGMRDRLAALGGTLTVTDGDGRFDVVATIPREETR